MIYWYDLKYTSYFNAKLHPESCSNDLGWLLVTGLKFCPILTFLCGQVSAQLQRECVECTWELGSILRHTVHFLAAPKEANYEKEQWKLGPRLDGQLVLKVRALLIDLHLVYSHVYFGMPLRFWAHDYNLDLRLHPRAWRYSWKALTSNWYQLFLRIFQIIA